MRVWCIIFGAINGSVSNLRYSNKYRCTLYFTVVMDPCEQNPCENGGTCQRIEMCEDYTCLCTEDYTGQNCEEEGKGVTSDSSIIILVSFLDDRSGTQPT